MLQLQHAAAHVRHHLLSSVAIAVTYLASVYPLLYFFLLDLQFLAFSALLLVGTSYHPAICHVTKPDVA